MPSTGSKMLTRGWNASMFSAFFGPSQIFIAVAEGDSVNQAEVVERFIYLREHALSCISSLPNSAQQRLKDALHKREDNITEDNALLSSASIFWTFVSGCSTGRLTKQECTGRERISVENLFHELYGKINRRHFQTVKTPRRPNLASGLGPVFFLC